MSPPPLLAIPDEAMVDAIHADLQQTGVLPGVHLLDSGSVTSRTLTTSQERFGVEVIGPPPADQQWQAHGDQGIDVTQFAIDWDQKPPTCQEGQTSRSWTSFVDSRHNPLIKVQFSTTDCGSCPVQNRCLHSERKYKRRTLTLRPQAQHEALQRARRQQRSPTVVSHYHLREGVEATISQGVRADVLRRSRSVGEAKTHLQQVGIAAAINVCRLIDWLDGISPAPTRVSAFQRLFFAD